LGLESYWCCRAGRSHCKLPVLYRPDWPWQNRGRYPAAIQAFQVALRSEPEDQLSWLRLGEAYSKAARLAAALKALERAQELKPDDWICTYFLAEVYRQMGQFQEAIDAFSGILKSQPSELRVLLTLAQTHLEFGRAQMAASFTARAETSFVDSVDVVLALVDVSPGFRRIAWKTAADALYELSKMSSFIDTERITDMLGQVVPLVTNRPRDRIFGLQLFPQTFDGVASPHLSQTLLETTLHAYSYRNSLGALDDAAAGSGVYDLGVSLAAYGRCVNESSKQEEINKEAIKCLRDAVGLDPFNERYWHALGDLHFLGHPKTAQHAYIKALELNNKVKSCLVLRRFVLTDLIEFCHMD
jgi:superkiller protein 3